MKKKKKLLIAVVVMFGFLFCIATVASAIDLQLNLNLGSYIKADKISKDIYGKNMSAPGLGASVFLSDHIGVFLDFCFVSAEGFSTFYKKPLTYKETQINAGLLGRFCIYRFAPDKGLNVFIKGGSLMLSYSEIMDEKTGSTLPGLCLGSGIVFYWKQWGAEIEWLRNIAFEQIEIEGLDIREKVNFSGSRFSLKAFYTF